MATSSCHPKSQYPPPRHRSPLTSGTDAYTCRVLPEIVNPARHDARHTTRRRHQPPPTQQQLETHASLTTPTGGNTSQHRPKHRWPSRRKRREGNGSSSGSNSSVSRSGSVCHRAWFWERGWTPMGLAYALPRLLCWLACVRFAYSINPVTMERSPCVAFESSYHIERGCECVVFESEGRSSGQFTSPGFPSHGTSGQQGGVIGVYPPRLSCILYTFIADLDEIVELTLLEFDLQKPNQAGRCSDYVRFFLDLERPEVNERFNSNYEFCGNYSMLAQKKHYSSSRSLIVEFHSDAEQSFHKGFRGRYRFVKTDDLTIKGGVKRWGTACSFDFYSTVKNKKGRLFSPKYPQNYPTDSRCRYEFYAMRGEAVKIRFQNIQLDSRLKSSSAQSTEEHCGKAYDAILVMDGNSNDSVVIASYCTKDGGYHNPSLTTTRNNELVLSSGVGLAVEFRSGPKGSKQGFAATFHFVKNTAKPRKKGVGLADDGSKTSKHSASSPPESPPSSPSSSSSSSSVPSKFSGVKPFADSKQTRPPRVKLPNSNSASGVACGKSRDYSSSPGHKRGNIASDGYPNHYSNGTTSCRYTFSAMKGERVRLRFHDVDLYVPKGFVPVKESITQDSSLECRGMDSIYVKVYIAGAVSTIGIYCGNRMPHSLMSNGDYMEIEYVVHSRKKVPRFRGFNASYSFVTDYGIHSGKQNIGVGCGFYFKSNQSSNGTFSSPNFPGLYPRDTECHYLFYGNVLERIHITFLYFHVEGIGPICSERSQSDYVEFSNFNIRLQDRKMYRLCGNTLNRERRDVKSDGNFFRVTFKSNHVYDATGFEAFYQFSKPEEDPYRRNEDQKLISGGESLRNAINFRFTVAILVIWIAYST